MKGVITRINNLYVEQIDVDSLRFLVIDDCRGRALIATVMGYDMEELARIILTTLLNCYEAEINRLNECIKEHRKSLEDEKKLKHPNLQFIRNVEEALANFEKALDKYERKKETVKKLLELLECL